MIIVADSGSTKTAWSIDGRLTETLGINPVRDSEEQMQDVVSSMIKGADIPSLSTDTTRIYFYGAGCISPYRERLAAILTAHFPNAHIEVASDMLGAARALCGTQEGIACILGTGSNSCLYDGQNIVQNVSPLGFILGDEGSGAVLGRTLVGDLLKEQLPKELREEFLSFFQLTPADIIERVYRQPLPNRFLASLVPFIHQHKEHEGLHNMLVENFRRFFRRNVALYHRPELPANFVGGIAGTFQSELAEAAEAEGFCIGKILKNPIEQITSYHDNK